MTAGYAAKLLIKDCFLCAVTLNHSDVEPFGAAVANARAEEDFGLKNLRAR
jgi:hypothetical protein